MTPTNEHLRDLLTRVENAVDANPGLTRIRRSGLPERAEFTFSESGWCVRINVRNVNAKGRWSRLFYLAQGDGGTPDDAVISFLAHLQYVAQATG